MSRSPSYREQKEENFVRIMVLILHPDFVGPRNTQPGIRKHDNGMVF